MTPEEILAFYETAKAHATDNKDLKISRQQAIEAIKAYAREMLSKQRANMRLYACTNGRNYKDAIENAPYPKELL